MGEMLLWFSVVLLLFAIGDCVATATKAKLSAVFITLLLFLILFVVKIIPGDIIERAGLTAASNWAVPMIMFSMGTTLSIRQFIDEWRTVLTAWLGIIAVIIGVSICIPFLGRSTVLASIPVINGALPATTIMTTAAMEKGLTLAAATATVVFAVQKFVGTPIASRAALAEANRLIAEYRAAKEKGVDLAAAENGKKLVLPGNAEKEASGADKAKSRKPVERFEKFYSTNVCILLTAFFAFVGYQLGQLIHLNYSIVCLAVGVLATWLGIVPKDVLAKAKMNGFINMVVFAAVIPSLANISLADLGTLLVPVAVMFAVAILSIYVMMKILPGWKLIGSKSLAFGVGFCQMLGFPTTYLVSNEVCNAVGQTQEERDYLMTKIMPRLVVGGLACLVSVIVAGMMAPML